MSDPRSPARHSVRFGDIGVDLRAGELSRAGVRIVLPDQPLRILARLLQRPGDLVTRDELRRELWPDNTFVDFEHGLNSAIKRLRDALGDSAETPRFIETLPRRGYRFIAAIEPAVEPAPLPSGSRRQAWAATSGLRRIRPRVALTIGAMLVASAAGILGWLTFAAARSATESPGTVRMMAAPGARANLVAVAPFDDRTADGSIASLGQLTAARIIQAISRVEIAAVIPEPTGHERPGTSPAAAADPIVAARHAGAALAVTGAYYLRGDRLEFHARILDARTGQPIFFVPPVVGPRQQPADALAQLEQAIAGAVAAHFDHAFGGLQITSHPPLLDAYLEYRTGRDLFERDYRQAVAHLQRAVAISPGFLLPRLTLAMAYDNLGDRESTTAQMAQIADSADRLTKAERLLVEYVAESQARRPADALRALFEVEKLAPHSWIVNYSIQMEGLILNRPGVAIEAFDRLPLDDRFMRYNAWRLEALARALQLTGHYERELKEVKRAQAYQPGSLMYLASETTALAALGRLDDVARVVDASLSAPSSAGTPGEVMENAALELRAHGHRKESLAVAARAVDWFRGRPHDVSDEAGRAALARALYLSERWDESSAEFAALSAVRPESVEYGGFVGVIAARQRKSQQAFDISDRLRNLAVPTLHGRHTYWRACIAATLGDKQRAVDLLREALGQGQYLGSQIHQSPHLESLSDFAPFMELVRTKD